ncbi:hypothetical protein RHMOL_Rhmol08G0134000 [Rhododendron molle]|uniref:Uncharacterized protein n=1 Tax=Rhododendron molle TaxID=49168 RepID=A0ACC0MP69_RHOML|nr:hypothetical protein RHMOL_Rhmol08G0134000 [Rhododendron molle]
MEIELGHKNFSEMTRVEMVMMADGRGRRADGGAVASLVMEVRRLDCEKDPIAAVVGKIQGLEDGVGRVLGKIDSMPDELEPNLNGSPTSPEYSRRKLGLFLRKLMIIIQNENNREKTKQTQVKFELGQGSGLSPL